MSQNRPQAMAESDYDGPQAMDESVVENKQDAVRGMPPPPPRSSGNSVLGKRQRLSDRPAARSQALGRSAARTSVSSGSAAPEVIDPATIDPRAPMTRAQFEAVSRHPKIPYTDLRDLGPAYIRHLKDSLQEPVRKKLKTGLQNISRRSGSEFPSGNVETVPFYPQLPQSPRSVTFNPTTEARPIEEKLQPQGSGNVRDLRMALGQPTPVDMVAGTWRGALNFGSKKLGWVSGIVTAGFVGTAWVDANKIYQNLKTAKAALAKAKQVAKTLMKANIKKLNIPQLEAKVAELTASWEYYQWAKLGVAGAAALGVYSAYRYHQSAVESRLAHELERTTTRIVANAVNEQIQADQTLGTRARRQEERKTRNTMTKTMQKSTENARRSLQLQEAEQRRNQAFSMQGLLRVLQANGLSDPQIIKYILLQVERGQLTYTEARTFLTSVIGQAVLQTFTGSSDLEDEQSVMNFSSWKKLPFGALNEAQMKKALSEWRQSPGKTLGGVLPSSQAQISLPPSGSSDRVLRDNDISASFYNMDNPEAACQNDSGQCVIMTGRNGEIINNGSFWDGLTPQQPTEEQHQAISVLRTLLLTSNWDAESTVLQNLRRSRQGKQADVLDALNHQQAFWLYIWMGPLCSKWIGPGAQTVKFNDPKAASQFSARSKLFHFTTNVCRQRMAFLKTMIANNLLFLFYRPDQVRQLFQRAKSGTMSRETNVCLTKQLRAPAGKAIMILDDCCPGTFWIMGMDTEGTWIEQKFRVVESGIVNIHMPSSSKSTGIGDWTFNHMAITYNVIDLARELKTELVSNLCWKFIQNEAAIANTSNRNIFLPGMNVDQFYSRIPRGDDQKNNYAVNETPINKQTYEKALARATAIKAQVFLDRLQKEQKQLMQINNRPRFIGRNLSTVVREDVMKSLLENFDAALKVSKRQDTGKGVFITNPAARKGFSYNGPTPVQVAQADKLFANTLQNFMSVSMSSEAFQQYKTKVNEVLQNYQNSDYLNSIMKQVFNAASTQTVEALCPNGMKPAIILNRFSVNPVIMVAAVPVSSVIVSSKKCNWYTFVGDAWFMQTVLKQFVNANIPLAVARERSLIEAWQTALPNPVDRKYFQDILYTKTWSIFVGINMS